LEILPRTSKADEARHVAVGYILGTPVRLQIEQRAPDSISEIVDAVEKAIGEEFGYTSVSAKMQAIVFQAHYPG
jgi:hypothetical protein